MIPAVIREFNVIQLFSYPGINSFIINNFLVDRHYIETVFVIKQASQTPFKILMYLFYYMLPFIKYYLQFFRTNKLALYNLFFSFNCNCHNDNTNNNNNDNDDDNDNNDVVMNVSETAGARASASSSRGVEFVLRPTD